MIWFAQGQINMAHLELEHRGQGRSTYRRNLDVSNRSAENAQDALKYAVWNGEPEGVGSDFSQTTMFSNR